MRRWLVIVPTLVWTLSAWAEPDSKAYQEMSRTTDSICHPTPHPKCWMPLARSLAQLGAPANERERESQLFGYWMLANAAYYVGDFSESRNFFDVALKSAKTVNIPGAKEVGEDTPLLMIQIDAAALAISMHDYALALTYLDEFTAYQAKSLGRSDGPNSISLLRCAALLGLNRVAEAEAQMQTIFQQLDFSGQSPWEGFPWGPQPLDPYQAGRRIAAYFLRHGDADKALTMLQTMETKRREKIARVPKEPVPGGYWASLVNPADILDDEASVYLAQGRDDLAEPALRASLQMREKTPSRQLQRTLTRLAALSSRAGRTGDAEAFSAKAAAVQWTDVWQPVDPLADMLGLADF